MTAPYTAYTSSAAAISAAAIQEAAGSRTPTHGIILGSGLGGLAKRITDSVRIPFAKIPGFPEATVAGHEGAVIVGTLGGEEVVALSGRFHMYEGHPPSLAGFPVRVMHALGARELFVSNAAGGISSKLKRGDLMVITDHLNLMFCNPLTGPAQPGEARFPDMTNAYDPALRAGLHAAAGKLDLPLREGVYGALLGPSYETPAEIAMLKKLGADAVGMSTVPEVLVARALGMRVAGVSCITNMAAGISKAPINHDEVLEATNQAAESFQSLVLEFLSAR
jgi:purine-nucleoside phosphorylase